MAILDEAFSKSSNRSGASTQRLSISDDTKGYQESNVASHDRILGILTLPLEIVQHILSFLDVQHLQSLYRTCREFKTHAEDDRLWLPLLRASLPDHDVPSTPSPASSYHQLYLSHHPYWFLPQHRIWFSDEAYNGKLILIKFNAITGTISGYRLAAERPPAEAQPWSIRPSVIIHHVDPRVYLSTDDPVLVLTYGPNPSYSIGSASTSQNWDPASEVRMRVGRPEQKINAALMLSKNLPKSTADVPNVLVWPPRTIPDMPRVRSSTGNNSSNSFMAKGHKPSTLEEISQTTFRLRTWSHFTQGMLSLGVRIGEEVSTWSTLDPSLYTPTKEKPYQGLYVGDYAAHGCEFLLVLQTERAPRHRRQERSVIEDEELDSDGESAAADEESQGERERSATRRTDYVSAVLAALRAQQFIGEEDEETLAAEFRTGSGDGPGHDKADAMSVERGLAPNVEDPDGTIHQGSIEAIKITGDVNIPRGEHTFIADDIGPDGTIRIAHESPFRGARVVRSRGHVAARGFMNDDFIPSQLFLINSGLIAQYWVPFRHISYYKRIDIDDLMGGTVAQRRASE